MKQPDTDSLDLLALSVAPPLAPPAPRWLDTRQAWKTFAAHRPQPPDLADCAPLGTDITDSDPRLLYHGQMRMVRTPAISRALPVVHQQILANRQRTHGRIGIIIEGPRGTGKTVLQQAIGLHYEHKIQRLYAPDDNRIPVITLSVPAPGRGGARNWPAAFAAFLGLERDGGSDPTRSICHVMRASGTLLVLIDGIQHLRPGADTEQTFDYLEYISEQTGATYIYCGRGARSIVDPMTRDRETPLEGGEEPWGDHMVLRTRRIGFSDEERAEFTQIVDAFDRDLRLHHHTLGELTALAPYLHKRSKGYLRALSHLVCQAAQQAMLKKTERITEELLDSLHLGRSITF
ncbi:AAA family ATPase [Streptomyces albireticuli]|uniref:AAA family ATPase n=1 Tax=Streptomyces albireticuli TaxID=1940 RepID=UPI0036C46667